MYNKKILKNGLTVIHTEDNKQPVVSLQAWIKFGSADENEKISGIAHLFEHLLFKGTKKRKVGQVAKDIESLGGEVNAYTTYDYTVMHITLPSSKAEKGIEILSDCIQNSQVDEQELEKEKEVIIEEMKMRKDMPAVKAWEKSRKQIFGSHTYGKSIIGSPDVIKKITRAEVLKYYKKFYNSKKIAIIITGNINFNNSIKLCDKYFKQLSTKDFIRKRTLVKNQKTEQINFVEGSTPHHILRLCWPSVQSKDIKEMAALDIFCTIIGHGQSSILYKDLVLERQLVRQISASQWNSLDGGSFDIGCLIPKGHEKFAQKIVNTICNNLTKNISIESLTKAKNNIIAQKSYAIETVDGLADHIGYYWVQNLSLNKDLEYYENIKTLNQDQVLNIVSKYLTPKKLKSCWLLPSKSVKPNFTIPNFKIKKFITKKTKNKVENPFKIFDFKNTKIIYQHTPKLPFFHFCQLGLGGARLETKTNTGIGSLWTRSIGNEAYNFLGEKLSRDKLNNLFDSTSASYSSFHGNNSWGNELEGLDKDFNILLDYFCFCSQKQIFTTKEVNHEKKHIKIDFQSMQNKPGFHINEILNKHLYGTHPYGFSYSQKVKNLKKISNIDINNYHNKQLNQKQIFVYTGPKLISELISTFENKISTSKKINNKLLTVKKYKKLNKIIHKKKILDDKEQTHLLMVFPTTKINHPDNDNLLALQAIFNGQGGRLFLNLRDKKSLCYSVYSSQNHGIDGGYFSFYIGTSKEKISTAINGILNEIDKISKKPPSKKEWHKTKDHYLGSHIISQQKISPQNISMGLNYLYDLDFNHNYNFPNRLKGISEEKIKYVAKKYLYEKPHIIIEAGA